MSLAIIRIQTSQRMIHIECWSNLFMKVHSETKNIIKGENTLYIIKEIVIAFDKSLLLPFSDWFVSRCLLYHSFILTLHQSSISFYPQRVDFLVASFRRFSEGDLRYSKKTSKTECNGDSPFLTNLYLYSNDRCILL